MLAGDGLLDGVMDGALHTIEGTQVTLPCNVYSQPVRLHRPD